MIPIVAVVLAPPLYIIYKYRRNVKNHMNELAANARKARVIRVPTELDINANSRKRVMCLELNPSFVEENKDWKIMSLGQYLTELRPANATSGPTPIGRKMQNNFDHMFLQKELEIAMGKMLLQTMGYTYGAAILPLLGSGSVSNVLGGFSLKISKFLAGAILADEEVDGVSADDLAYEGGSLEMSLMELIAFININQKMNSSGKVNAEAEAKAEGEEAVAQPPAPTPLDHLKNGEKINEEGPNYNLDDLESPDGNGKAFVMERDFHACVAEIENRILWKTGKYDPDDRSFPPPFPVNERLLPDLYLGKGDAKCTHTQRERYEHRLFSILLNKLSYNYYLLAQMTDEDKDKEGLGFFKVIYNSKVCHYPEDLIQALVDNGHTVEVCPRVQLTNFGTQLCVKEKDGSFTYIPVGIHMRTGVERSSDGEPAHFAAPHGGLDLKVSGPIIGRGEKMCWLQFYISIGGVTCFHPDEDIDAPWAKKASLSDIYSQKDALRAVRMCALISVVFNRIATEFNLPFGGYGVLGMCNDSATFIDLAIRGSTNGYPLLSTGRFLNHTVEYLIQFKEELMAASSKNDQITSDVSVAVKGIENLIRSTSRMPTDLHISPATIIDTYERYQATYPESIFLCQENAKAILKEKAERAREYLGKNVSESEPESKPESAPAKNVNKKSKSGRSGFFKSK